MAPLGPRRGALVTVLACGLVTLTAVQAVAAGTSRPGLRPTTELGPTGAGPNGIVVDAFENVYTADARADTVTKISPGGTATVLGATGARPTGAGGPIAGPRRLEADVDLDLRNQSVDSVQRPGGGSGGGTPTPVPSTITPGTTLRTRDTVTATGAGARAATPRVSYSLSRAPVLGDDDVVALRARRVGTPRRMRKGRAVTLRSVRRITIPRRIAAGEWYLVACASTPGRRDDRRTSNDCRIRSKPLVVDGPRTIPGPRRARLRERA